MDDTFGSSGHVLYSTTMKRFNELALESIPTKSVKVSTDPMLVEQPCPMLVEQPSAMLVEQHCPMPSRYMSAAEERAAQFGLELWECYMCNKRLVTLEALIFHVKGSHKNGVVCEYRECSATYPSNYRRHVCIEKYTVAFFERHVREAMQEIETHQMGQMLTF